MALTTLLIRIPAIKGRIGTGRDDGAWWTKFVIDISDPLAWRVIQELGHVLNYLSLTERLPTVFIPVSPPPYLNGGPADFLSWVIECRDRRFSPKSLADCLAGRLPNPIDDRSTWSIDE
ncbi:hypothetical protein H8A92_14240 [Bradyrhizobium sp. 10BB]|nr:hypothetical protein [Bradyrhizobium acaciae]